MSMPPLRQFARSFPAVISLFLATMPIGKQALAAERFKSEAEARRGCASGAVAWLNTASGKIHHKGNPWYGHTQAGAYICEAAGVPGQTHPQWKAIAIINAFNGGATLYINLSAIQHHGNNMEMPVLMDFNNAQEAAGVTFRSSELRKEYDCKNGRWRILASSVFDQNMGAGQTVQTDNEPDEWKPAEPGSPAKTEWNRACTSRW